MTPPTHPHPAALPLLLLASAVLTLCLVVSGQAAELVRPAMVPLLVIAAAVLLMLFVAAHVATEQHGHEQSHHGLPTVAWLLLLPVALACFSSPAAVATHEAGQQLVVEGPGRGRPSRRCPRATRSRSRSTSTPTERWPPAPRRWTGAPCCSSASSPLIRRAGVGRWPVCGSDAAWPTLDPSGCGRSASHPHPQEAGYGSVGLSSRRHREIWRRCTSRASRRSSGRALLSCPEGSAATRASSRCPHRVGRRSSSLHLASRRPARAGSPG